MSPDAQHDLAAALRRALDEPATPMTRTELAHLATAAYLEADQLGAHHRGVHAAQFMHDLGQVEIHGNPGEKRWAQHVAAMRALTPGDTP